MLHQRITVSVADPSRRPPHSHQKAMICANSSMSTAFVLQTSGDRLPPSHSSTMVVSVSLSPHWRRHWIAWLLLPWLRDCIVEFHGENPLESAHRHFHCVGVELRKAEDSCCDSMGDASMRFRACSEVPMSMTLIVSDAARADRRIPSPSAHEISHSGVETTDDGYPCRRAVASQPQILALQLGMNVDCFRQHQPDSGAQGRTHSSQSRREQRQTTDDADESSRPPSLRRIPLASAPIAHPDEMDRTVPAFPSPPLEPCARSLHSRSCMPLPASKIAPAQLGEIQE